MPPRANAILLRPSPAAMSSARPRGSSGRNSITEGSAPPSSAPQCRSSHISRFDALPTSLSPHLYAHLADSFARLHFVSPSVYMHLADSFPFGSAQGFGSPAPLAGCAGTFHGKLVFPHPAIKLAFFLFDSHLADSLARSLSAPLVFSSPPGRGGTTEGETGCEETFLSSLLMARGSYGTRQG